MRYSNSKEYKDPFYVYTAFIDVPFEDIPLEGIFTYNGTTYVKKSTRTAFLQEIPSRWFYFSKYDIASKYVSRKPNVSKVS